MQQISFGIPYDLDVNNPRYGGLVTLIEMYRREGETLFTYIKGEAASIRKQITEENKALVDQVEWVWSVLASGSNNSFAYQVIATPTLNGSLITDEGMLRLLHLRDGATQCSGFVFRIINNVIVTNGGGWLFHNIENGTTLEDDEVAMFNEGKVPGRFQGFGHAPKV